MQPELLILAAILPLIASLHPLGRAPFFAPAGDGSGEGGSGDGKTTVLDAAAASGMTNAKGSGEGQMKSVTLGEESFDVPASAEKFIAPLVSRANAIITEARNQGKAVDEDKLIKNLEGTILKLMGKGAAEGGDDKGKHAGDKPLTAAEIDKLLQDGIRKGIINYHVNAEHEREELNAAQKYLDEHQLKYSIKDVLNWMDSEEGKKYGRELSPEAAAKLMSLPDVQNSFEKRGRDKATLDQLFKIEDVKGGGAAGNSNPKTVDDYARLSDKDFKEHWKNTVKELARLENT